jgi:hypothetical protein
VSVNVEVVKRIILSVIILFLVSVLFLLDSTERELVTPTLPSTPDIKATAPSTLPSAPDPIRIPTPESIPPAEGDWIVAGQCSVKDRTIILNGNLIVNSGANLVLSNVELIMNCTYDGEYGISVNPGGSISIQDSNITSTNPLQRWHIEVYLDRHDFYGPTGVSEIESPRFSFIVNHAANFVMKDSQLHGCGWGVAGVSPMLNSVKIQVSGYIV